MLRALWRQRGMLLRSQGRHVQQMQKALTQMNVQRANVTADVVGESGQKILRAIVQGERDGQVLGAMKNVRIRASVEEIAKSLPRAKREAGRAAQALRLAAAALRTSQSALGAYFRRMCARMDKPKAVAAAAHKLARLIYTMLTKGEEYTDQAQACYEERYRERVLRHPAQRAN